MLRHFVNISLGMLGMMYFFGIEMYHVVLMSLISWLLMAFTSRQWSHVYVCTFVFTYLSLCHIHTVIYRFGNYDLEITTNTMLLTLRLQALAFSYNDAIKPKDQLTERQKQYSVEHLPSLIEMMSFTFFV